MSRKFTIYFTSDTHGYVLPTNFIEAGQTLQGLSRMRFPKNGNTLIIDGGDTIQGAPLTYFCHKEGIPTPVSNYINQLQYDYITLGNHDFNYGLSALKHYLKSINAKCLCANIAFDDKEIDVLPAAVHTLDNGLRLGLIGITTDWIKLWERPEHLQGVAIHSPLDAAKKAVSELSCDLLIGIYHGGFERDIQTGKPLSDTDENIACRLIEEIPFDILFTGHQHAAIVNEQFKGTHIVQTPPNATHYIKLTGYYADGEKNFYSCLLPADAEPVITPELADIDLQLQTWLDSPIAKFANPLLPDEKISMAMYGSPIANFINHVQLARTGADISVTALGNQIRGFYQDVTVRDVVSSYIYSNTLTVLEVNGRILKEALEQCATYFERSENAGFIVADSFLRPKQSHYNYDYFLGIEYAFDLSRSPKNRLIQLTRHGKDILDDDVFSLCMCSYRATGAGNFDMYKGLKVLKEDQTEISEILIDYLVQHPRPAFPMNCPYALFWKGERL